MATLPRTVCAEVAISFDGTGAFDGPFDVVTADVDGPTGLSIDEWRDGGQQLNPPKVAAASFSLLNDSGKYTPSRADSPVYQRFLPGRPVRFRIAHGEQRAYRSGAAYRDTAYYRGLGEFPLGEHVIDELEERVDWGERQVAVSTLGRETVLTRAPVTVPLMVNPRVDECVSALLDAAGWPSSRRDIAVSDTRLSYWWCDEREPWAALQELLASEGPGTYYVDRAGTFRFESRNYRTITERCTTPQAAYYDVGQGPSVPYRTRTLYRDRKLYRGNTSGLSYVTITPSSPYASIRNRATYTTRRRAVGALGVIWDYGATLSLDGDAVRTLYVRPSDPFLGAVTPVAGTDYTVTSGAATVALTYSSGFLAILTVTAGPAGATIAGAGGGAGLSLRAQSLTVVSETTVSEDVDTSGSVAMFSPIPGADIPLTMQVDGWPEIEPAAATAVCNAWVLRYMRPRPQVDITLVNADAAHVAEILSRRASDRITVANRHLGLAVDFWVNAATLTIAGAGGRVLSLVLGCERCDDVTGAIWDQSLWDSLDALWGV